MDKTLIIYDNNGVIFYQVTGNYMIPNGVPYLEIEVPIGKYIDSVDVINKQPIYKDIPKSDLELLQDKIDILVAENKALHESQDIQDRTIVENDMRMMDIEWALEEIVSSIDPTRKINLAEVFTMKIFERSATYFNQLKQMIERENYDSKEEMERILNKYRSGKNPRITEEEYDKLFDMLYPPVYDIPTILPEA